MAQRVEATSDRRLWIMCQSVDVNELVTNAFWEDNLTGLLNDRELEAALTELMYTQSLKVAGDPVIPVGFINPTLSLPLNDFAPDYFELNSKILVSHRFRAIIDQPANVVQYWHVDVVRGSAAAYAQDYMMLRVLAHQPALDWERSVYQKQEITNRRTGEVLTSVYFIDQFVPLQSLTPHTEIFRAAEHNLTILVTDALAERVACVKIDGVSFDEPETIGLVNRAPRRQRMDYGILVDDADLADWAVAHGINTF